jgi:hypothetical protein
MVTLKRSTALTRWIAAAVAAVVIGVSAPAHATTATNTVKQILMGWDGYTPQLKATLGDNTTYFINNFTGSVCGVNMVSMDLAKGMLSILQSALLSGKNVNVSFTNACGSNWLLSVELVQ